MENAITVDGLVKAYGENHVLRGVSFDVEKGTVFALLGSNGAGKTTTINILTTLITADAGHATLNGFDVASQPEKVRQQISLTGQFAAVDDILTARENLELIADLRHVPNSAKTAQGLLETFGLLDAADRRVLTFSGGMRRRLDIAMSLIGSPSIIFFDEPSTGLDPEARNGMWETIRSLARTGTTIVLTTQYLEEADQLADKIAILHGGTIVASGTARELKKLVPSGVIELTFEDEAQRAAATRALELRYRVAETAGMKLTVDTNNSVEQLAQLFTQLGEAHVEPSDFSQRLPTLDDVFLKLTSREQEVH
ncbi:MAG TPA: ATP-binding cassette domain-containing protein [Nitrolancea sp.]|nr:ATP-binding cassette domain-containing protein [Nitrolancea sp.]